MADCERPASFASFCDAAGDGPGGAAIPSNDGVVEIEYRGPLPALLALAEPQFAADVRIEPLGLGPLYARIHDG